MTSPTPETVTILDDLADAVSDLLVRRQIPFDAQGATFATLNLLHLAATLVVDQHHLPPSVRAGLQEFFVAACDKDEGRMERLNRQLLGAQGAFLPIPA